MVKWKPIRVRLRAGKDDDIGEALEKIQEHEDKSDIVRMALRQYFFGKKQAIMSPISDIVELEVNDNKSDEEIDGELNNLLDEF